MKDDAIQPRLTRLQRECEVSVAPAALLLAACSALVLVGVLGMSARSGDEVAAQPGRWTQQVLPPSA